MTETNGAPDPYAILGVGRKAKAETIKAAWRRYAMRHHPDHGGSAAALDEGKRAHALLSDPEARKRYDATGEWPAQRSAHQHPDADLWGPAAELVMAAVLQDEDPGQDILGAVRRHVDSLIGKQWTELLKAEAAIARSPKFGERITRKGEGDNVLRRALEGHTEQLRRSAEVMRKKIAHLERMLTFLDGYSWRVDQHHTVMMMRFMGGSTSTSSF